MLCLAHLAAPAERAVSDLWSGRGPWQGSRLRGMVVYSKPERLQASSAPQSPPVSGDSHPVRSSAPDRNGRRDNPFQYFLP